MRSLLLLAATAVATLAAAAPTPAMSGGSKVDISTVPFVGGLGNCTGTLIAPDRVLTAAHCLATGDDPSRAEIVIGIDAHDFGAIPESERYTVKGFAVAPGFKLAFPFAHKRPENATAVNDVGLIVLTKPVTGIAPVAIAGPGDSALERPGRAVRLLGYGAMPATKSNPFPLPKSLLGGALTLIGTKTCLKSYPHAVVATDICAEDLGAGATFTEPCAGDSGGPLLAQGPNGPVQIGVTSWGSEVKDDKCGAAHLPSVWMRVSKFHAFLTDPNPVLLPHTQGKVTLTGRYKLTCVAPAFDGSPAKLTYAWGIPRFRGQLIQQQTHALTLLKGATSKTFTPGGRRTRGKKLACSVTATNASGSWTVYSPSVRG